MSIPDFEQAKAYAFYRLETELPAEICFHDLRHTRDDVLPAAERLARLCDVEARELELITVAAAFHDTGFIHTNEAHEIASARITAQALPSFGFSSEQIEQVMGMILATRLPQTPHNLLEQIMADADLDALGRDDYFKRNELLRLELGACGLRVSLEQWYRTQIDFLENHTYFTPAARALRDPGKARNLAQLRSRLDHRSQEAP
jgi:uncharacterized protein